jgi:hypothetical protein
MDYRAEATKELLSAKAPCPRRTRDGSPRSGRCLCLDMIAGATDQAHGVVEQALALNGAHELR